MEQHWWVAPFAVKRVSAGYHLWRRLLFPESEELSLVLPWAELLALYQVLHQVVLVHMAEQQHEGGAN